MSNEPNRILDELAKMIMDAAGVAKGMRQEVETILRFQLEHALNKLDLVKRDEFEMVREMAVKTRAESEILKRRIEVLEMQLKKSAEIL
ncbi:MAG: hypothetical protein JSC085_000424 [Candidatus Tokpelaia sp. JSC085]|nr:MAG: hypothetical protein JSC085_000424 [Candidatus Tokpelaia sp. JSC085]